MITEAAPRTTDRTDKLHLGARCIVIATCLSLGACAQVGASSNTGLLSVLGDEQAAVTQANATPEDSIAYWAKAYAKNPRSLEAALNHTRALKASGNNRQALAVMKQASRFHPANKELAAEYGRLALGAGQVGLAKKYLELADDPAAPDWRVIMARGTAHAKEGKYGEATRFFERAQKYAPDHPSLLSNLALAYTMNGQAAKGEQLLKRAIQGPNVNAKIRQNLAIVLGLQGKYDEATRVGAQDLTPDKAEANSQLIQSIINRRKSQSGQIAKSEPTQEMWQFAEDTPAKPPVVRTSVRKPVAKEPAPKVAAAPPPPARDPGIYLRPSSF